MAWVHAILWGVLLGTTLCLLAAGVCTFLMVYPDWKETRRKKEAPRA